MRLHIYIYIYIYVHTHIHIYRERERNYFSSFLSFFLIPLSFLDAAKNADTS